MHDEVARSGVLDVGAVAEAAGVSPATFYAHFDTHDDALASALDLGLGAVIGVSNRLFHIEALLEQGLDAVIDELVRGVVAAFRVEALVMRAALARLPHHRGIRDVYRRHEAASRDHITRQVELGQKAGVLGDGDPGQITTTLLVLTEGLNNPLLLGKRPGPQVVDNLRRAVVSVLDP